ncbi:MAG: phosphoribosylamine--glycine ligase [bacterium]
MKVLVIGSGGREHALVWAFSRAGHTVYSAPGNAGIAALAECVEIDPMNFSAVVNFVRKQKVDLTVVGPEAPLVAGLADQLQKNNGSKVFGPNRIAAQLEGDKAWTKNLLAQHNIPTAQFAVFDDFEKAKRYIATQSLPIVIKASGLAGGKGVVVADTLDEAMTTLTRFMKEGKLGAAGKQVVIEEFLEGEEVSIIALCDGKNLQFLIPAQDHKKLLDGDAGPNTGGMGAYAPVPAVTKDIFLAVVNDIFQPLLRALEKEAIEYRGAIYAGLMLTKTGPKVLEFNCRFGDPETQVLVPLIEDDLAELCLNCALGKLETATSTTVPESGNRWALCVVAASRGYPGNYEKGLPISGKLENGDFTLVFHAGTKRIGDRIVTNGGRVFAVTGIGSSLIEARDRAYYGLGLIHFPEMHYRRDIGEKGLRHLINYRQAG